MKSNLCDREESLCRVYAFACSGKGKRGGGWVGGDPGWKDTWRLGLKVNIQQY